MELDDLDRELAEYNAEVRPAEPEAAKAANVKKETVGWIPFGEDQFSASDADYQLQYQQLENIRTKLESRMEEARKNYYGVEETKKKTGKTNKEEWLGTTGFFILVFLVMAVLSNTELFLAWLLLLIAICVFAVRQYRILILQSFRYKIRCIQENGHPYVESRKIKTYQKEEEYWHRKMTDIKTNLEHLETWEKKLQANHGLKEEELEEMKKLGYIDNIPSVYTDEKPSLGDWIRYRFGKKTA